MLGLRGTKARKWVLKHGVMGFRFPLSFFVSFPPIRHFVCKVGGLFLWSDLAEELRIQIIHRSSNVVLSLTFKNIS